MDMGAERAARATRVFISYARADGADIARQLRDELRRHGVDVWLDTDDIRGGDLDLNHLQPLLLAAPPADTKLIC
jgi:hypothetical protein